MTRQLVDERPTTVDPQAARRRTGDRRPMEWADLWNAFPAGTWVAGAAAVRGALVALSGMVVTVSLAIVIWAITPQSGDDASAALHAGFAALAAANLLPLSIGGVSLTLPPLLITVLLGVLLGSSARRGRLLPDGRAQECLVTLVGGGVYGLLVLMVTRGLGPDGVVAAGAGPLVVGVLGYGIGTLARDSAWRSWWRSVVPQWLTVAVRAATVGSLALVAGAAAVFAISLGLHSGTALTVATAVAPGGLDGAGLGLLQLLYLPNAVLATVGFSTGAGVRIGPGSYLPWGSSPAELPGVPLLAALPSGGGPSAVTGVLLVPVLAAGLLAWTVVRGGLTTRLHRLQSAAVAAGLSAVVLGAAAFAAGGGVGSGRFSVVGAPALLVAATVAGIFAVVGAGIAGLVHHRTVPWRPARDSTRPARRRPRSSDRTGEVVTDDAATDDAEDATADAQDAVVDQDTDAADTDTDTDTAVVDQGQNDDGPVDEVTETEITEAEITEAEITEAEGAEADVAEAEITQAEDADADSVTDPDTDAAQQESGVNTATDQDDETPGSARGTTTA